MKQIRLREWRRDVYEYTLNIDDDLIERLQTYLNQFIVPGTTCPTITEEAITKAFNYNEDESIELKLWWSWREETNFYTEDYFEWIRTVVDEWIWDSDGDLVDGECEDTEVYIEEVI